MVQELAVLLQEHNIDLNAADHKIMLQVTLPHTLLESPQGVLGGSLGIPCRLLEDSTKSLSGVYIKYMKTRSEIYCQCIHFHLGQDL